MKNLLFFKIKNEDMKNCNKKLDKQQNNNIIIKKKFIVKNTGNLPINVELISINNQIWYYFNIFFLFIYFF